MMDTGNHFLSTLWLQLDKNKKKQQTKGKKKMSYIFYILSVYLASYTVGARCYCAIKNTEKSCHFRY